MDINELQERIIEIEREISALPAGSITTKKIKNGLYYYHRLTVNGKRKETYLDSDKALELKAQIEKRKSLEKEQERRRRHHQNFGNRAIQRNQRKDLYHYEEWRYLSPMAVSET